MRTDRSRVLALTLGMALLTGCGSYEPAAPPHQEKSEPEAGPPQERQGPPKGEARPGKPLRPRSEQQGNPDEPKKEPGDAKTEPQANAAGDQTELKKAEFGVGAKGHDYQPGALTTPLSVYFTIQERMVFEIKLPKAIQMFKAMENRFPKSQEEFMEKVVKENDIELPPLRDGDRYVYDPKAGELMVATTRASAQPPQ